MLLKRLLGSNDEDMCPNCGAACLASDVLCPKCGKNLDELYEHLPPGWTGSKPLLQIPPKYIFLSMWVAATAIGMGIAEVVWIQWGWLDFELERAAPDLNLFIYRLQYALVTAIAVGTLQWVVLRKHIPRSWLWIILTTLGMLAAILVEQLFWREGVPVFPKSLGELAWTMEIGWVSFFGGLPVGFSQWILLRKRLRGSWRWILVTGVGYSLGSLLPRDIVDQIFYPWSFFGIPQHAPDPLAEFIISGSRGLVLGICTGLLLLWLLERNGIGFDLGSAGPILPHQPQSQPESAA